ncbi:uncharacterized protein JCM15063_001666 [Sporobolomyces koalae]|uniref:uncharacterized protein n=1 Tax=Sporobolomyces koalae TaxID=500713 RepID=UPI003176F8C5
MAKTAPPLAFHMDAPEDASLTYADCVALSEDFELESAHFLKTLRKQSSERLEAVERHWQDSIASLDPKLHQLALGRFVSEFAADFDRALNSLVREHVPMRPMSTVEQSARKRKRFGAVSPTSRHLTVTDDETDDLFAASATLTNKKPRNLISTKPSASSSRKPATSLSTTTTTGRSLRIRPSTTTASDTAPNFVYRQAANRRTSASTSTVTTTSTVRKPRRGESIVVRSLNDSPLGQFVASDDDDQDDDDQDEDDDDAGDWDLMDRHEASKVEDQHPSGRMRNSKHLKKKPSQAIGKGQPPTVAATKVRVPSSTSFGIELPQDAPDYDKLKQKWKLEMIERLKQFQGLKLDGKNLEQVLASF